MSVYRHLLMSGLAGITPGLYTHPGFGPSTFERRKRVKPL